ncbi:RHS repeat protein [Streptomyces formicae]|uniref:RHS repeat protein n=1 Tax=Streptomyces formicae TaxID=1616117 RepID=UPI001F5A252F|nr:RHS repeat protein [Streptomyces formicae]
MLRDQAVYDGDGGALVSATSHRPWRSAVTATRTRTGLPALEGYMTGIELDETHVQTSNGLRTTRVERTFDSYGMVDTVTEHGDVDVTGDEKCTTTFARNTTTWMLDKVSRSETVAVVCTATPSRPADVVDDVRTYYDNGALGAAPVKGLVTKTERINGTGSGYQVTSSTPSICGATNDQLCYDTYGRQLAEADPYGKITRTSFTPATGEVPTTTVVTNPLGHTVTSGLDPRRAQPTKITDANGKVTTSTYDLLGRVTKAWLPNRSGITYPTSPNYEFDYLVRTDGPIVTTTKTLTHDSKYKTSYTFQDGLLRELQTQEESPDRAGMLVTEAFYNTRGEARANSGTYFTTGAPSTNPVTGQQTMHPSSTETVYDGTGRPTVVIAKRFTDETKRTTITYTGDTTTVTPPAGGIATTTVVDAHNRTTELKQYTNAGRTASQSTLYKYDKHGRLAEVADPSGAKWTYKYDVRGRQSEATAPDTGTSTTVYDQGDRATDVTDARSVTLHTDYDELGRAKALKKGTATLAAWTYDTVAKGQLTKATRYDGTNAYTTETTAYNSLYLPLTTKVTIPASEGMLAGTYEWATSYNAISGQVEDIEHPEIADLPYEIVINGYTAVTGLPDTVTAGDDPVVSATTYDHYGKPTRVEYGEFGRHIWTTAEYDDHTGLPSRAYTDRDTAPERIEDTKYTYDPSGNITQIAAAYGQDTTRTTDTQCFQLDALRRITEAWTNTGETCATTPSTTVVGGSDAYWTSYTYDAVGNRGTETQHKTPSGPTADTVRTYTAPAAGKHALPSVTQTGTSPRTETYTYDAAGNTKTRKIGTADLQTFDWDDEGHLKSVTEVTDTTSYLYDTVGQSSLYATTSSNSALMTSPSTASTRTM